MKATKIFDKFVEELQGSFEKLPDYRTGENMRYEIKDAAMSAFGVFFTQSASFLAYQRLMEEAKGKSNVHSLFGAERIPSDNQIRNLLDPQEPEMLYDVFVVGMKAVEESGQLKAFDSYGGQVLISIDGTQTISSRKIHCAICSRRELANGEILYAHGAILPVIVKAGESRVLVLEPEFISPQDGREKQDCERAAIKRWVQRNAERYVRHQYTLLGDDLYACQPICQLFSESGFNFILVCKPDSHVALYEQVAFLSKLDLVEEVRLRHWNGRYAEIHQYRFVNGVPLRREEALQVNWCEIIITREDNGKQTYHNTFITNHQLTPDNIIPMVRDGRARWKSENETNNVLKTKGYHLEHNFGHGKKNLSVVFAMLMMLAFLVDQVQQLACELFRAVLNKKSSKRSLWEEMRALFHTFEFESMTQLFQAIRYGFKSQITILTPP